MMLMCWAGLMGCLYAPLSTLWWWAVLLGLGQGGNFSVALSLIVLRSADARVAASLSAMTQGIGYTMAAAGPYLMGVLHDLTGSWAAMGCAVSVARRIGLAYNPTAPPLDASHRAVASASSRPRRVSPGSPGRRSFSPC